jgi:TP53 regulating kinase-like protein
MMKGRKGGVPTPTIYGVHSPLLFMEFMHGITVREWLEQQQQQRRLVSSDSNTDDSAIDVVVVSTTTTTTQTYKTVAETIGRLVATLHNTGTIHGDLTTSNMMFNDMDNNDTMQLHMIDFGLARGSTTNPEEMAVDLYVLERAILSTHPEVEHIGFTEDILKSYKATCCKSDAVLQRLSQVRLRGRKRECFG